AGPGAHRQPGAGRAVPLPRPGARPLQRDVHDRLAHHGGTMSRPAAVDGRTQRRTHNIDVVVDAMLQLLGEGQPWPSAADIAARAGLSERSVYRYFDDLDALARAAVETQIGRADHLFHPLDVDPGA